MIDRTAQTPIVADGSQFDPKKPYLLATIHGHNFGSAEDGAGTLDEKSERLFTTLSLNHRFGVIVAPPKHATAMQGLGHPVVGFGQTVAFPMDAEHMQKVHANMKYSGALTAHCFSESPSLHIGVDPKTKEVVGNGRFDAINHMAGAYIPLGMALKCATEGETHITLQTTNSGVGAVDD